MSALQMNFNAGTGRMVVRYGRNVNGEFIESLGSKITRAVGVRTVRVAKTLAIFTAGVLAGWAL